MCISVIGWLAGWLVYWYQFCLNYLHAMRCNRDIFWHASIAYISGENSDNRYNDNDNRNDQSRALRERKKEKIKRKSLNEKRNRNATLQILQIDKSIDICVIRNVIMLFPYFIFILLGFASFASLYHLNLESSEINRQRRHRRWLVVCKVYLSISILRTNKSHNYFQCILFFSYILCPYNVQHMDNQRLLQWGNL